MASDEVQKEYIFATNKKKQMIILKYNALNFDELKWGLEDREIIKFDTPESLLRGFDEAFTNISKILTDDLLDASKVEAKLKVLKQEFDTLPQNYNIDSIKSFSDDSFIPIVTFLKKSPILYPEEIRVIDKVLASTLRLSQNIDENKENVQSK